MAHLSERHGVRFPLVMTNIAMERSTTFKFGKSTISMVHFQQLFVCLPEGSFPLVIKHGNRNPAEVL